MISAMMGMQAGLCRTLLSEIEEKDSLTVRNTCKWMEVLQFYVLFNSIIVCSSYQGDE